MIATVVAHANYRAGVLGVCRGADRVRRPGPGITGKIERWHQSIQTEFLDEHCPFESLTTAQSAIDAWRSEYNTERPHESRDMDTPATHFASIPPCERETLELWRPPELSLAPAETDPVTGEDLDAEPGPIPELPPTAPEPDPATPTPDAVERERRVPASGNLGIAGQVEAGIGSGRVVCCRAAPSCRAGRGAR